MRKVITGTSFSRFFGLLRDVFKPIYLEHLFHDIFVICLRIQIYLTFFAEELNQAFVPIYAEYEKESNYIKTNEFLNSIAGTLFFAFFFTLLVLVFAQFYLCLLQFLFWSNQTRHICKGFKNNVSVFSFNFIGSFRWWNSKYHQKFSIPAFTPVVFNLSLIIAAVFIAPKYEIEIFALAWGVLLAGFIQLLIQIAPLRSINRLPIPKLNFKNEGVKSFLCNFSSYFGWGIVNQLLIDTIFASLLETGSPTWLYVSDRLVQFPMGIFAIGIGTVLLPTLSKLDVIKERQIFINTLQKGQRFVLFIGIPSLIGLMFCAEDIISAIFYRGEFTQLDVFKSSYSLIAFSLGLPFFMYEGTNSSFFCTKKYKNTYVCCNFIFVVECCFKLYFSFCFWLWSCRNSYWEFNICTNKCFYSWNIFL